MEGADPWEIALRLRNTVAQLRRENIALKEEVAEADELIQRLARANVKLVKRLGISKRGPKRKGFRSYENG